MLHNGLTLHPIAKCIIRVAFGVGNDDAFLCISPEKASNQAAKNGLS